MVDRVEEILDRYEGEEGSLIQVLLDVQNEYNWLPPEVLEQVSRRLGVPRSYPYRVASFYKALSLAPRGKHQVSVCLGTACHVRGGEKVLEAVSKELGVSPGETTADLKFTLERVACLGCCGLAPTMMVNDQTFARLNPQKVKEVLAQFA